MMATVVEVIPWFYSSKLTRTTGHPHRCGSSSNIITDKLNIAMKKLHTIMKSYKISLAYVNNNLVVIVVILTYLVLNI